MKEVDHRIKNSLQIVSSLLHLQARKAGAAAQQFHSAAARVAAIAAVHQELQKFDDVGTVALDRYLTDLCKELATASGSAEQARPLVVDADPLVVSTDLAVPLALIVNELVTNAIQHSRPGGKDGRVHVVLKNAPDNFSVSVSDPGDGPDDATQTSGLGTQIIEAFARQIDATVAKERLPAGYAVTITVPRVEPVPNEIQTASGSGLA